MNDKKEEAEISVALVKLQLSIDRLVSHQQEMKSMLSEMKEDIHGLDMKIINGDNQVKEELLEKVDEIKGNFRDTLLNLTIGSLSIVVVLVGSILGYLTYKHGG